MTWQSDLLNMLGAPDTANNEANLNAWNACEGNSPGQSGLGINNPFNTTLDYAGAPPVNSAGVRAYGSLSDGISATAATIRQRNMAPIYNALMSDAPRSSFANAIGAAPWGTDPTCVGGASGTSAVSLGQTAAAASKSGSTVGCKSDNYLINYLGLHLLNGCQVKALVGGLGVAAGAATLGLGVILVVAFGLAGTRAGRQATALASRAPGPIGAAAKGVRSVGSGRVAPTRTRTRAQVEPLDEDELAERREARNSDRRQRELLGETDAQRSQRQAREGFREYDDTRDLRRRTA